MSNTRSWGEFIQVVGQSALDEAARDTPYESLTIDYLETVVELDPDEYFTELDALRIIAVIWEDRDLFLTLCACGLLPGASLLLLVAFTDLSSFEDIDMK